MLKTRIQFLSVQPPAWVDRRVVLLLLILVVFTMAMAWGEPVPQTAARQSGNVGTSPAVDDPAAAFSSELTANREQTNGVLIGSIVLMVIIVGAVGSQGIWRNF